MAGGCREFVIHFQFYLVFQNKTVVKEQCVKSANAVETFRFKCSYKMGVHGSSENALNQSDEHEVYRDLIADFPWSVSLTI